MDTIKNITSSELTDKIRKILFAMDKMKNDNRKRFVKKMLYLLFAYSEDVDFIKLNSFKELSLDNIQCIVYLPYYYKIRDRKSSILYSAFHKTENLLNSSLTFKNEIQVLWSPLSICGNARFCLLAGDYNYKKYTYHSAFETKWLSKWLAYYYARQCRIKCFKKNKFEKIYCLLHTMMKRDFDVSSHCIRVGFYAGYLAEKIGIDKTSVFDIEIAGALHDLGKLRIPKHILNKPTTLSNDEYELIKKHPQYTSNILEKIGGFKHIRDITLLHHERYDGMGYPLGLYGDSIPIESQIISIADSFDAMTTDRSYRKALTLEKALKVLADEAGKQFNPRVVLLAISLLPEIYNTRHIF
jgi:HD-GYP domain-containing protein (c-di-GMP phosphodiesterase class II)